MRIERLDLDGFGRFASRSWDLPTGLTVLLGPNEAGKTTLLNALRALLFGFEPTRDGRAWYPALAGGRRGGRLQLTTASGERWTVERHGERGGAGSLIVRAPNGNTGGQETLDRILGGADRELFTNIFAFGLGELQSIHSLSGEGVRSRIYGAGTGLGGMSAADLERQVRTQQEATFRPQGRNQELNRLVARIDELGAEIAGLERDPVRFEALHRELAALDAERQRLVGARDAAAARSARAGQLVDAAAPAARLTALEAELAADDSSLDTLPPELDRLLAERLAERAAAREVVDASRTEVEEIDARLADIRHDEPALAAAAEITALADERALHATRAEAHTEAVAAAAAAAEELATLAPGPVASRHGSSDSTTRWPRWSRSERQRRGRRVWPWRTSVSSPAPRPPWTRMPAALHRTIRFRTRARWRTGHTRCAVSSSSASPALRPPRRPVMHGRCPSPERSAGPSSRGSRCLPSRPRSRYPPRSWAPSLAPRSGGSPGAASPSPPKPRIVARCSRRPACPRTPPMPTWPRPPTRWRSRGRPSPFASAMPPR